MAIEVMKWAVRRKRIALVRRVNSLATMANVSTTNLYATKLPTVQMNRTNHFIAMLMSVPKWKSINADTNALILSLAISAIVIKDTSEFCLFSRFESFFFDTINCKLSLCSI